MNKYRAVRTEVDGIIFASKKEAARYAMLKIMKKHGQISDLVLQPRYDFRLNGVKIGFYKADFSYVDNRTGETVTEDVKGRPTPVYRLKKKLMRAFYGIEITEV